jgi:hypothetical protein
VHAETEKVKSAMKCRVCKWMIIVFVTLPLLFSCSPKGTNVNQKKIDRERAKQEKEAQKQFDQALKRHKQIQTKETRARMKQSHKESKKLTPIGH